VIQIIMVALIIIFPSLVTVGLDRPVHSGEAAPVQILAPQNDQDGAGQPQPDDTADLFQNLRKPSQ